MVDGQHLKNLRRVAGTVYRCRLCGMCGNKHTRAVPYVCPVRENTAGFDHTCARGKVVLARGLLEGQIELSPALADVVFGCTLCGNCMTQCAAIDQETGGPLVDTAAIIQALRADLLREHPEWAPDGVRHMLIATRQYHNPWAQPRTVRQRWARGLGLADARAGTSEVLLFTGCTIASTPSLAGIARRGAAVLQRCGVTPAVLGRDEPCCGSVQQRVGDTDRAGEMRREGIELLNSVPCERIVTFCAGCTNALRNEWARADVPLRHQVQHFVEFLAEVIDIRSLSFRPLSAQTVVYHDPCHIGRHLGIFDAPRRILEALPGIRLVERSATRENTICCGAGGGMRLFEGGALAQRMAADVVASARAAGADALVTACPFCEMNISQASMASVSPLPVYDIVDLVAESLDVQV